MQFDGDTGSDFHDRGGFSNMGGQGQGANYTFKMNGQDMGGMGGMGGVDPS
jgi:hypothetical protein